MRIFWEAGGLQKIEPQWILLDIPTISDPNRICKKFWEFKRIVKVRIGETPGMVTVEKCGWEGGGVRSVRSWTGAGGVADQIARWWQ